MTGKRKRQIQKRIVCFQYVMHILDRREYLGHTILGKTSRDNFKTKRKRIVNEEEQYIFYDTHEAIIDQETYDKAQRMRKRAYSQTIGTSVLF